MPDIMRVFENISYPEKGESWERKDFEYDQVRDFIDELEKYDHEVEAIVESSPGLKIMINYNCKYTEIVEKNISWLTSMSVIKLKQMRFTIDRGDPETYSELIYKKKSVEGQLAPFGKLIAEGILTPVFESIEDHNGISGMSYYTTTFSSKNVLDVGFSNDFINNFAEKTNTFPPQGVLELRLPLLANVPLSEVLKLRSSYGSIFTNFQIKLIGFIQTSNSIDSVIKLRDLLLQLDKGIDELNREFQKIEEKERLEKTGITYSFGVVSLVLLITKKNFYRIKALFDSNNSGSIKNIRLLKETEQRELPDDPFYIPYMLANITDGG